MKIAPELARDLLRHVVQRLGSLSHRVVFVGGVTTGLLITDDAVRASRTTTDLDCIVEAASRSAYHRFERELASIGIYPEPEGPICRFRVDTLHLDVMPTDEKILGFSNRWYGEAVETAVIQDLGEDADARVVAPYCFVATKLEAFENRAKGDYLASHDMEDLITVVNGRPEITEEMQTLASRAMREHVASRFRVHLDQERFLDAVEGHLPPDAANQQRKSVVLERLRALASAA